MLYRGSIAVAEDNSVAGNKTVREMENRIRELERQLGLKSCFRPVKSPQPNRMSEAFVKTLKRDYVRVNPLHDAEAVLSLIGDWVQDYNETTHTVA